MMGDILVKAFRTLAAEIGWSVVEVMGTHYKKA